VTALEEAQCTPETSITAVLPVLLMIVPFDVQRSCR
jgi:hypothetical protein